MSSSRMICRAAALSTLVLAACGGATQVAAPVETVPEPPPEPPSDALAWLPVDASVLARIDLEAFRATPLSSHLPEIDEPSTDWLDLSLVDRVSVAVEPEGEVEPGVVGVLEGRFGARYLETHAAEFGAAMETHGERTVYVHDGTYWLQPRPELLVGCTLGYLEWVLGRYEAGPDAALRTTELYEALAPAVEFDSAHVAVLLQDQDGSAREALQAAGGSQVSFLTRALAHVARGAVRVQFVDGVALTVLADVDSEAHAQELLGMLQAYLDRWKRSPLILLLGLRELLDGIGLAAEGKRVALTASVTQGQIDSIMERLKPMFEGMFNEPSKPVSPSAPPAVTPASDASAGAEVPSEADGE